VIWDPQREFTVNAAALQHRHKLTPYHREQLKGVVRKTFLRGKKIYDNGAFAPQAVGVLLL
jgi:allantoinase